MLVREDYLKIIEEIRNIDSLSLDGYIENKLIPLKEENEFLIEILYKDIYYIIKDIGPGEGDLAIENGDFVIENDDFKVTGYQTRLNDLLMWLHQEMVQKFLNTNQPFQFSQSMERFEKNYLEKVDYTVEYKDKLDNIKQSILKERKQNYLKPKNKLHRILSQIFDLDNLELNPKISGVGINIKRIIQRFKNN